MDTMILGILGTVTLAGLALAHQFAPAARMSRRRRRNSGRVVAKVHRPMVTFSVRTR